MSHETEKLQLKIPAFETQLTNMSTNIQKKNM